MRDRIIEAMQKFSRAVIAPVKMMAVMGLFLAVSVILRLEIMPQLIQSFGGLISTMMDSMLNNLALIFCVAIAASMAQRQKVEAALIALVAFLFFLASNQAWLTNTNQLAQPGDLGFYGTGQTLVLGFQVVDMNVFLGMILGCIVAWAHNRFSSIEFAHFLGIYGGSRLTFMILIPIVLVFSIAMCTVWPIVNGWIGSLSGFILTSGLIGVFIYSFGNRFLIPTGLHHLLWMPFCFTALGGTAEINGQIYNGAANIFYAEMANPGSITFLDPSLRFATFGFVKIFGSIAVALALIHCAQKQRKEEVQGMVLPSMFVATVAGITEPLDFTFLFASPLLWFVHSILTAISETVLWALGARTYMLFGLLDSVISNAVFSPSVTRFYIVIGVGLVMMVVWYLVFVFLIRRFNIKTPGREEIDVKTEESVTKDTKDFDLILEGVGGYENIQTISHCFTRLRIDVKDEQLVNPELLSKVANNKGLVVKDKHVQLIIGMGVQSYKEALCKRLGYVE